VPDAGARSIDELWSLLIDSRCAITRVPADRFNLDHFGIPGCRKKDAAIRGRLA